MKTLLLLIIFILIIGGVGFALDKQFPSWGIKEKVTHLTGQFPIETSKLVNDSPSKFHSQKTMYRWQDEQGQWHFGENPPPNTNAVVIKESKGNTYDTEATDSEKKTSNEPKRSPVLFPQFTPAH